MNTRRNLGQELIDSIHAIKAGEGKRYQFNIPSDIHKIRQHLCLSQYAFASLMGVSPRTLQEWEQGRRKPSGSAYSLLRIAQKHPEAFMDL